MSDESTELLRDIRDHLARQERTTKRAMVGVSVIVVIVTCIIVFLAIRVTGVLSEFEQAPRPAAMVAK